jgi:hypothetical protein
MTFRYFDGKFEMVSCRPMRRGSGGIFGTETRHTQKGFDRQHHLAAENERCARLHPDFDLDRFFRIDN